MRSAAKPTGIEETVRPVQSARVVGYFIPEREADCSGVRPSWYPIQWNVCDEDEPDPVPLAGRQLDLPPPKAIPF